MSNQLELFRENYLQDIFNSSDVSNDFYENVFTEKYAKELEESGEIDEEIEISYWYETGIKINGYSYNEDEEILNAVAGKPCVIIVNKGDRPQVNDLTALQKRFGKDRVLLLSAKTGGGLEQFTAWLQSYVYGSEHAISGGAYVQNTRHENLLREALLSVEEAIRAAASMLPYDCLVIDLHKAIDAMGLITGDTLQDEIINEIFSKFCVGK